jgi:hypothetical protein
MLWGYVKDSLVSSAADDIAQAQRALCNFESEIMHNVWNEGETLFDVKQATQGDQIEFY